MGHFFKIRQIKVKHIYYVAFHIKSFLTQDLDDVDQGNTNVL